MSVKEGWHVRLARFPSEGMCNGALTAKKSEALCAQIRKCGLFVGEDGDYGFVLATLENGSLARVQFEYGDWILDLPQEVLEWSGHKRKL